MSSPLETDIYDDLYGDDGDKPSSAVKEESAEAKSSSGESSLPAKPTQSAELSYSAQIAQQFSAYKQTPAQERQQRNILAAASRNAAGEPKPIEGSGGDGLARRPVRPSEMKDEGKLFIGGLSWDTSDDGLRNYFSEFGKVEDCTILRDPDGRSRGFAFLTFEDPSAVNAVLMRDHVLDGKTIDPKRAIPREEHLRNTRYFVGGLSHATTSDTMRAFFSAYGKVVDCTVMVDRDTGRSKGFGFVTFEDASNTDQLVGNVGLMLDDKPVCRPSSLFLRLFRPDDQQIEVKVAQPRSQREQARMKAAGGMADGGASGVSFVPAQQPAVNPQQMGMLYQRMMGQMPMMMGMNGMGMGMGMGMGGGMSGNMGGTWAEAWVVTWASEWAGTWVVAWGE
ncbi:RNA-binding domain-containing protein [Obba rivulosa]|uniref:RNA-binding domain-containing protein n=1 Tax=Obba rivulosa TaxID=1052685 RepID=A0A8E2DKC7_9APHY|nr:RNA-binding domain-containing protein [Obba rivulosa]